MKKKLGQNDALAFQKKQTMNTKTNQGAECESAGGSLCQLHVAAQPERSLRTNERALLATTSTLRLAVTLSALGHVAYMDATD